MDNNLRVVNRIGSFLFTSLTQTPGRQQTALRSGSGLDIGPFVAFRTESFQLFCHLYQLGFWWAKVPSENFSLTGLELIWCFSLRQESACTPSLQLKGVAQSSSCSPHCPKHTQLLLESLPHCCFQGFVSFSIKLRWEQKCLFIFGIFSMGQGQWGLGDQ